MSQGERLGLSLLSSWAWQATEGGLPADGAGDIGGDALAFKCEVRGGVEDFGNT